MGNIRSLKHLDLSANELVGEIPIELSQLNNLTYLFLANNGFDEGPIPPFVFGYDNLRELSLKQTRRTGTISGLIETMDKLVGLDLGSNGLSSGEFGRLGCMHHRGFSNESSVCLPYVEAYY